MNANNMTLDELVRAIDDSGEPLALELVQRVFALQEDLEQAKAEIVELENGPLCTDDDHCDYEHLKKFFDDARDIIGINGQWLEVYEVADQMREQLHEAFDS